MKIYITVDENNKVASCDTNNFGDSIELDIEPEMLESMKIMSCYYSNGELIYSEDEHTKQQQLLDKDQKYQESLEKYNEIIMKNNLNSLSDDDAYEVRYLYDEWCPNTLYKVGDRILCDDNLYKCQIEHTSQSQALNVKRLASLQTMSMKMSFPSELNDGSKWKIINKEE